MNLSASHLLPGYLIKALCTTLLHSLWQGVLLAAVAGVIIICTRKPGAALRYNLLMAAMLVFVIAMGFTFTQQLATERVNAAVMYCTQPDMESAGTFHIHRITAATFFEHNKLQVYIDQYAGLIVQVWLLIVLMRSVQLFTGLTHLHKLRTQALFEIDEHWQQRVDELSAKLGIRRIVNIAESSLAQVPMVIGHLKPLILIPVGLVTALRPEEVEAIIIHELAHVRRKDYLFNLLVSLMEIVFFFNPAVLWIASLIKAEREHCCDDLAVVHSSKVNYIKALVACQERQLRVPAYAMALGQKQHLLGRVKRMIAGRNRSLNTTEKSFLAICLLCACLTTTVISNAEKISEITGFKKAVGKSDKVIQRASGQANKGDATAYKGDTIPGPVHPALRNGSVKDSLTKGQPHQTDRHLVDEHTIPDTQIPAQMAAADSIRWQQAKLQHLSELQDKQAALRVREDYQAQQQAYRLDSARSYKAYPGDYHKRKTGYDVPVAAVAPVTEHTRVIADAEKVIRRDIEVKNAGLVPLNDLYGGLATAMMKEGLTDLVRSYKVDGNELILNGRKVPDGDFTQFKSKHLSDLKPGTTIYYNYDTNTVINKN